MVDEARGLKKAYFNWNDEKMHRQMSPEAKDYVHQNHPDQLSVAFHRIKDPHTTADEIHQIALDHLVTHESILDHSFHIKKKLLS